MEESSTGAYLAFGVMTVLVVGGALGVVLLRNVFHAAVSMVVCFLGVAGVYFGLQADFLAVMQVLIYIGAVAILIAFAVMLTRRGQMAETNRFAGKQLLIGGAVAVGLGGAILSLGLRAPWKVAGEALAADLTRYLGEVMLSRFAIPFEIAAVLLLVALVGAVIIAMEEVRKSDG